MKIYTSESVSVGHPDKLADQISDALLDAFLEQDRTLNVDPRLRSRVAIETLLTRGVAVVAGEVTTQGYVDITKVVRETIAKAGYTHTDLGFDGNTCGVLVAIQGQSEDIAMGVDTGGAGDQGMMFGMATRETKELMPLPISIAHALTRKSVEVRATQSATEPFLRPDAKSQVSVEYDNTGRPVRINTIVLSHQHSDRLGGVAMGNDPALQARVHNQVQEIVKTQIIDPVLKEFSEFIDGDITYHINPTGNFVIGGPQGDTGVTGRKIIVDTYGGMCPHGGGAFSGKDPTKVDRSAAYIARYLAKNVVAANLADRVVIQLAYAIGVAQPVAINIETFGTETVSNDEIVKRVRANFDLSPAGIINELDLLNVSYHQTACNGHFGNSAFPWESTAAAVRLG